MSAQDPGARNTRALPQGAVFNECLVEPDPASASRIRVRRGRSIAASAFLELSILAVLLIWPLFATGSRLVVRQITPIPPYGHRADPQEIVRPHSGEIHSTHGIRLSDPPPLTGPIVRRPTGVPSTTTDQGFPDVGVGPALDGANSSNIIPLNTVIGGPQPPAPTQPERPAVSAPVRRSEGVQSALLIHRVEPRYPPLAQQIHREGTVQLHAVISRDGTIESLEVLSGDPLFIRSAMDAVREWRYRPTVLSGEPVQVETYITVYFRLAHD